MEDNTPEIRKICKSCGASKMVKDFVKCKSCVGGYTPRCRHCVANHKMIVRDNTKKERVSDDFLAMSGVGKDTYIEMYLFLQKIGYDLTRPIAEQFAEKHNLKFKKRSAHRLNKYNPENLGLV
jgi:hypothetical protein